MRGLLEKICEREGVTVAPEVYPLVIRAGGGSPRDSLSILDQLLAGADDQGVAYERALALLGVTDIALIDTAVDALASADGAALFGAVEKVVDAGHDPRRFAVDLLERLRDLILLQAVPDAADRGLVEAPGDQLARMQSQIETLGPASLTRFAEIVHDALGEMRGTTSPRLLLEVMCARMLLPAVSNDDAALLQRLDAWLRLPQRRLLMLAGDYDALRRDAARFTALYRLWTHAIAAHAPPAQDAAPLPSLLLVDDTAALQLLDKSRWRRWISTEPTTLRQLRERGHVLLQRSDPAFPITILGV
jgi:DNA polymerase III gamma/tau subunit